MVSKIEILEYLLINGPTKQKELKRIFSAEGINFVLLKLHNYGLINKFVIKNGKKIYFKPGETKQGKKGYIVELSDKAIEYLKKYNATSFYDTPMYIICSTLLSIRHNRKPVVFK